MLYFDTSFLVPLILREASSEAVAAFFQGLPVEEFSVSHWTRVEFSSMLAREVRMGGLEADDAAQADERFEAMVDETFAIVLPNAHDFDLAKKYLGRFASGLRAGDALHLAIAGNRNAKMIYSLDKRLIKAGDALGLRAGSGIELSL